MGIPLPWYALAIATTVLNGATLGFIGWREQNRALTLWAEAWMAWGLAVIPLAVLGSPDAHPLVAVICGLLWVVSALFFLRGAYAFAGQPTPRAWYAVAGACVVLAVALGVGPGGAIGMVPLVLFQSVGLLSTGVVIIRGTRGRTGAWLCGVALIALGLHLLDAPIFAGDPVLFQWGFVLAIALQILAALGMLMLYYEHVRAELLQTQRVLEDSRRIEALGRVAGGVAHDFNNLLTVMRGHLDLIGARGEVQPAMHESLSAIDQAIESAARLTRQLLAFGRRSLIQPEPVDVHEVVRSTLDLLKNVIPENIELRLRCGEGPRLAVVDRALLEQIILNLVTNARDSISTQGRIQVDLEPLDLPQPSLLIRVTDDGAGMDAALIERIFEPFFTSKPRERGTGLGLASVQGAVTQLGGEIRVESRVGGGSTFEVVLPWVAATDAPAHPAGLPGGRPLSILVVDDDESVRETTAKMLEGAGHRVERASDGRRALEMLRVGSYDLVLCDVVMPQMGGVELFGEVSKLQPQPAMLLTSGYPLDADLDRIKSSFLAKPFSQRELLNAISRLAGGGQSADGEVKAAGARAEDA